MFLDKASDAKLYRNQGGGSHVNALATSVNHANTLTPASSIAIGDYNNDGLLDIAFGYCNGGFCNSEGTSIANELHRGDGGGMFTLVTGTSISAQAGTTTSMGWGDFDGANPAPSALYTPHIDELVLCLSQVMDTKTCSCATRSLPRSCTRTFRGPLSSW